MYKVLIVDDEAWVVKSLQMAIDWNAHDFEVVGSASDGEEALACIAELMPDLVVTDIRMPVMSGLELMEKARARWPLLQFVIISVYAEFEYARKAIDFGAAGYCLKPADEQEMAEMLKKVKARLDAQMAANAGLLTLLGESHSREEILHSTPGTTNHIIKSIVAYLDEYYASEITLSGLAEQFHLNPSYLCRVFKRACGKTLTGYLVDLRLQKACQMLRGTCQPVNTIAKKCGYVDYFYFARLFKRSLGITPTQYREGLPAKIPTAGEDIL